MLPHQSSPLVVAQFLHEQTSGIIIARIIYDISGNSQKGEVLALLLSVWQRMASRAI